MFDQYVRKIIEKTVIQIVGLRYFNVYGPQENHKGRMASVAFHFNDEVLSEGRMRLFEGSAEFLRDFVYVGDAVGLNLFFFENPSKKGIFNCGTGKSGSFLKIAEIMKELYDIEPKIEFIKFPDELKGKYQAFTQADLTKLRQAGYSLDFTSLEDGIGSYVRLLQESGGYFR